MSDKKKEKASVDEAISTDALGRRQWDKSEFEQRAKNRGSSLAVDSKGKAPPPVKRELLKGREYDLDLDSKVGKTQVITTASQAGLNAGYHCDVCDCVLKDSMTFLDHINGIKHQRMLGMSMNVKKSSLSEVKEKMEAIKRKMEERKHLDRAKEFDLDDKIAQQIEDDEKRKRAKKEQKKPQIDEDDEGGVDPDIAEAMGFAGFGSSSK